MDEDLHQTSDPPADPPPFELDIDDVITDLDEQHAALSRYIDDRWDDLDVKRLARLLSLHARNASRIARLLRHRCAIHGDPPDLRELALNEAIGVVGDFWGVDLRGPDGRAFLEESERAQIPIDLDHLITDLHDKQQRISRWLGDRRPDLDPADLARLFTVYGQNATRLGRLLRDRHTYYGKDLEELDQLDPMDDETMEQIFADALRLREQGPPGVPDLDRKPGDTGGWEALTL